MNPYNRNFYLGVTNYNWFRFHQNNCSVEVNFWKPSTTPFKVLEPGELFLFKLKAPYNKVAGGGNFVSYVQYPLQEAWRILGQSNGAETLLALQQQMKSSLGKQKGNYNPLIGCILLENTVFFELEDWIECPLDFSTNIVSGKGYHPQKNMEGRRLLEQFLVLQAKYSQDALEQSIPFDGLTVQEPRFGKEYVVRPRIGQGIFRSQIIQAYQGKCAITQEHTLPVLEAGHIRPYSQGGTHSISNGILMRSDFHTLFDLGYLTITPKYHLEVSPKIKEHFSNGIRYKERHGTQILLPSEQGFHPNPRMLSWHNENIYLG